jgi:hypothetical protein
MPGLKHLPATAAPGDVLEVLAEDAAVIIDGLMTPDLLARVRTEIMPYVEATPTGRDNFTGRLTTRTGALIARSPACRDLVMDTLVNAATEAFLAPF